MCSLPATLYCVSELYLACSDLGQVLTPAVASQAYAPRTDSDPNQSDGPECSRSWLGNRSRSFDKSHRSVNIADNACCAIHCIKRHDLIRQPIEAVHRSIQVDNSDQPQVRGCHCGSLPCEGVDPIKSVRNYRG